MKYGELQEMILALGNELQELVDDEVLTAQLKQYAACIRQARREKVTVGFEVNMSVLPIVLTLMRDHAPAMEKIICQTQGISKKELSEQEAEETLNTFAKTFNEVLKPFFMLCGVMAF